MKNKMIKTAGLVLASTTMLMANGVVANESIQDKPCEVKVMEDGQAGKFVVNFGIAIFTAGKIENAFDYDYKCLKEENKIEGPGYSYPMKFNGTVIATSNSKPHPLAKVFGDNNNEVTTFTSQDGTLEIKVMERDSVKNKEDSISSFEKFEKMMKREGYEVIARHPSDKKAIVFEKDGERMSIHYKDI